MDKTVFYEFSLEDETRAREVSLISYLKSSEPDRYYIDNAGYGRDAQTPKFKVCKRNKFYFNSDIPHNSGNPIDFLRFHLDMSHPQAVRELLKFADDNPFA